MEVLLIVCGALLWWAVGTMTLIYDWTRTLDLRVDDLGMCALGGVVGPVWILILLPGWLLDSLGGTRRVLIRRRKR
jgi:hypothetical protein